MTFEDEATCAEPAAPKLSPNGRDVVVLPWRGGWAVLRIGNERPGRVRRDKEAAVRDGLSYARLGKARLFLSDTERAIDALDALAESRRLDTAEGLGAPVLDARNLPGRREVRRAAELRAVELRSAELRARTR